MSVQAQALHRASALAGGLQSLAVYLQIPDQTIREWMFDVGSPPHGVFLRVIALLLDQSAAPADAVSVVGDRAANMTRL